MRMSIRPTKLCAALLLAAAVSASGLSSARAQTAPPVAATASNKGIVAEAFARWSRGEGNFFDELLAPDVLWTIKGSGPSAGIFESRDAFVQRAVRPFAIRMSRPVRPVSTRVWADGDHVVVNWDGEGVAGDGAPYRNSYAWIFRMRDGKAAEVTAFLDLAPYDDVLRRVPAPEDGAKRP